MTKEMQGEMMRKIKVVHEFKRVYVAHVSDNGMTYNKEALLYSVHRVLPNFDQSLRNLQQFLSPNSIL